MMIVRTENTLHYRGNRIVGSVALARAGTVGNWQGKEDQAAAHFNAIITGIVRRAEAIENKNLSLADVIDTAWGEWAGRPELLSVTVFEADAYAQNLLDRIN